MSGPDRPGAAVHMSGGRAPPTAETQVPPEPLPPRSTYDSDAARYMYYRPYPGSGSPLPPYPPPPYSAQPYPPYPAPMAYPPPYSAPYGYLTYPADKYPAPGPPSGPAERGYYTESSGGGQQDGRQQQEQGLVCTCHPHPPGVGRPAGGPAYHPVEDDDGLTSPGPGGPPAPSAPSGHGGTSGPDACSCDPPSAPPPLRRSASNFSEDSLVDGMPPAPAQTPAPAPATPPVVLRQGGGSRQPEKRRSLTQEYLAAQAAAEAARNGSRSLEGAELVRVPPPIETRDTVNGEGAERTAIEGGQRTEREQEEREREWEEEREREDSPSIVSSQREERLTAVDTSSPNATNGTSAVSATTAASTSADPRRLSQAYDDRPATATPAPAPVPDTRRLSQAYDDRPAVSTDQRRLSQALDERGGAPDPRRLSQAAYDERPCVSASDPRRLSQVYDDKPPAPDSRRLSQAAYDERPCVSTQDPRRLSQAYDDRPAVAGVDSRRPSQALDDKTSTPAARSEVRRPSQAQSESASDTRRLSQAYDDRPVGPAVDSRRLSQIYDDRPAGPAPDSRRLSQAYDDRPVDPAPDPRRLSQAYDDRPAGPAPDSRRLSQAYDDRPTGPTPDSRRLSQAYDDRPTGPTPDSRRLSQAYDDRPMGPTPDSRRLSQVYDDRPVGPSASSRRLSLSQMYDERPAVAGLASSLASGTAASLASGLSQDPTRRLSHAAYDERPAQSRRLSQPLLPTQQLSAAAGQLVAAEGVRGSSEPRQPPGTGDDRPPCQKYDDRPCTASTDNLPSLAAARPWWEKPPDRPVPQNNKTRAKDSPSRRSSVDRTTRSMQLPSASSTDRKSSPPAGSGDAAETPDSPLAFTVDFGPADKRLHVKDSISRWAPRTRRPAASKDEREETRSDSGDLKAAGSGVPRPRSFLRRRQGAPGYHSEGYFSSDQDVDSRESGRRAPLPRQSALARTPSPRGTPNTTPTTTTTTNRLSSRRATVTRVPASGLKKSATMGAMPRQEDPAPRPRGGGRREEEDAPDDVSEAGTYTIENEPDGEEAARQVEAAFSGLEDYGERRGSEGERSGESSSKEGSPDRDTETSSKPSAYSSGGSNWIEQWAAEVTKHNQENLKKAQKVPSPGATTKPPTGSSSPWSRQTLSPDGNRPRRKLPTPPGVSRSPVTGEKSSPGRSTTTAGTSLDTESYLRTTEDVMSALQARIDAAHTADESDSVCSSEGSDGVGPAQAAGKQNMAPASGGSGGMGEFKFNRALSLRRARLGLDTESATSGSSKRPTPPPAPRPSSGGGRKHSDSESGPGGAGGKAGFARTDGGRYSLRMANGSTKTPPSRPSAARKPLSSGGPLRANHGPRAAAQAAQASRDQEMANWKRRKNYDPLKAAKEAKNKKMEGRGGTQSDTACTTSAPLRSASFHGTDGLNSALLRRSAFAAAAGSEDEAARRRPGLLRAGAAAHRLGHTEDSDSAEVFHDGASAASSTRKVSLDGSRRLVRGPAPASLKNKVKLEALDNLVISTIHTLSSKIRGNSESLVSKLKCQFEEEDVRHTLLDDVLTTLTTDMPTASKTSSRDLAGILKNLRKVEQAVQVLEQVLCDDDCDVSDEDADLDGAKFGDGFY